MIRKKTVLGPLVAGGLAAVCIAPAWGTENAGPLSLSFRSGGEYESNITVDAQDLTTRAGDESLVLEGNIGYRFVQNGDFRLTADYNFFQSLHADLTQFDLQIHGLGLNASTRYGNVDVGAAYRYNYTLLGSDSFLETHSIRPNIGFLIGGKTYFTLAYEYQRQIFKTQTLKLRNANRHSVGTKLYYIMGPGKSLSAGYKLTRHNTVSSELTYWGHTFDVGLKLPVNLGSTKATFRARYQFRYKDFSNITASIGQKRSDKRHTLRTSLDIPVFNRFFARLQYKYTSSISNLPTIDYNNQTASLSVGWTL
jgi:hypothetical protein